jgi:hypothetical protein
MKNNCNSRHSFFDDIGFEKKLLSNWIHLLS